MNNTRSRSSNWGFPTFDTPDFLRISRPPLHETETKRRRRDSWLAWRRGDRNCLSPVLSSHLCPSSTNGLYLALSSIWTLGVLVVSDPLPSSLFSFVLAFVFLSYIVRCSSPFHHVLPPPTHPRTTPRASARHTIITYPILTTHRPMLLKRVRPRHASVPRCNVILCKA